ncbi:hypothetical protein Prum_083980 [Phytohabitans rumicis]|uniref:Sulfatase N-terminal domain-containing protein n=1 Tax=Phytohabitans rumicis TaxID=1076125 RepID=A0A6V8LKS1_9ACTN|nr:hypothetical protein Prum_083980 [Phytohabitans rumicis]
MVEEEPPRRAKRELFAFLEVAALCGLAVAQPLLDITGKSPDFFLFYGASRREVLLLVLAVTVVPPVVLWAVGALCGLAWAPSRLAVHAATVGGLLAVLAVQVGKNLLPVRGVPLALLAILAAAGLTAAYLRWRAPAQVLRLAAVGPVAFALLFVFASPSSAVLLAREGGGSGPGGKAKQEHPPIVVLLLDEFPLVSLLGPDGRIDAATYPNFARLAGDATWYRNATGVSGWTPYAVPAMLTGKYPAKDNAAPHFTEHPDNLFTLLDDSYEEKVRESITQLCLPSVCERETPKGGLPVLLGESAKLLRQLASPSDSTQKPEESYQETTEKESGDDAPPPASPDFRFDRLGDNQPARFTDFLAGLQPAAKPTLHFLHLLMPHGPWSYLPSGVRYSSPDLPNDDNGAGRAGCAWPSSGTWRRWRTRIGCSARRSPRWRRRSCTRTRSSWSPRTTGSASRRTRRGAGWARYRRPATRCCGCRCSSRSRARRPAASTTATGSTSTCCPRSPTSPA